MRNAALTAPTHTVSSLFARSEPIAGMTCSQERLCFRFLGAHRPTTKDHEKQGHFSVPSWSRGLDYATQNMYNEEAKEISNYFLLT